MRRESTKRTTARERSANRRYMWEILLGVIGFMLTFLVIPELVGVQVGSPASVALALLPIVPVLWIVIALVRHIYRVDELQRGLVLTSLAIGFGAAMLIALTVAFLSTAAVAIPYPEWWVFIGGMSAWGITIGVLSYRAGR